MPRAARNGATKTKQRHAPRWTLRCSILKGRNVEVLTLKAKMMALALSSGWTQNAEEWWAGTNLAQYDLPPDWEWITNEQLRLAEGRAADNPHNLLTPASDGHLLTPASDGQQYGAVRIYS